MRLCVRTCVSPWDSKGDEGSGAYVGEEGWLRIELRRIFRGELLVLRDLAAVEDLQDLC